MRLVCLRFDDFGYWEIKGRALGKVAGFHAMLPDLNLAHRLIVSYLRGRPGRRRVNSGHLIQNRV